MASRLVSAVFGRHLLQEYRLDEGVDRETEGGPVRVEKVGGTEVPQQDPALGEYGEEVEHLDAEDISWKIKDLV